MTLSHAVGIIPAHAGFTAGILYVRDRRKDHPRTRGVYPSGSVGAGQAAGSSPHTRGLLVPLLPREAGPRIIPAHAGFTSRRTLACPASGDHPRTRGVYMKSTQNHLTLAGSSPHTRGLLCALTPSPMQEGIIPAHAGFTVYLSLVGVCWGDHPRTRGVYSSPVSRTILRTGSSPHTRGLQEVVQAEALGRRIIPAHAGFTAQGRCERL